MYLIKRDLNFFPLGKRFSTGLDKTAQGYQEEGVKKLLKYIRDGLRGGVNRLDDDRPDRPDDRPDRPDDRPNNNDDNNDDNNDKILEYQEVVYSLLEKINNNDDNDDNVALNSVFK